MNANLIPVILGGAVVVAAAVALSGGPSMVVNKIKAVKLPAQLPLIKSIAEKWGKLFSVPVPMILTIAHIESSFRPHLFNLNDRAMKLGGAWGVVAMTLKTGAGKVEQIRKAGLDKKHPQIAAVLAKWPANATTTNVEGWIKSNNRQAIEQAGRALLDPDLCLLLGVYMMSGLWVKYKGDHLKVAAAYHSGSKPVDDAVKAGVPVASKLGQYGKEYVARATTLYPTYNKGVA